MKIRLNVLLALLAAGTALSAATASAGLIAGVINTIDFVNAENVTKAAGNTLTGLQVGDELQGVLYVNEIQQGNQIPPVPEIHGVFDLTVQSIWGTPVGGTFHALTNAELATFTGTAEVFYTPTDQGGGQGLLGALGFGANTAIALYQGGSSLSASMSNAGNTTAQDIAAAESGSLMGSFGFNGNVLSGDGTPTNGYWYSDTHYTSGAADAFTTHFYDGVNVMTGPLSIPGALGFISNESLPGDTLPPSVHINDNAVGGTTFYSLTGTGNARTSAFGDPGFPRWGVHSSDPQQVLPQLPEPGTMLLMAMGLGLGLPYLRRRNPRNSR